MGGEKKARNTRLLIIVAIIAAIIAFVVGILIGRFATCPDDGEVVPSIYSKIIQEPDPDISTILIQSIEAGRIEQNLRRLTQHPHIAGSERDFELLDYIKSSMTEYGLDSVKSAPYEVLLSYPDPQSPNSIQLLNASGDVIFDSKNLESNYSFDPEVVRPFHAYSPKRTVTGELIYVNYGRVEDYDYLAKNTSVNVTGKVVIARYGKIFRGSKVDIAAKHGAVGIIIYSDPKDYTWPEEDSRVFPDTWWLPPTAAQRGSIFTGDGDPLTPGRPSIRTAYRYPENETDPPLPPIPSHPIGYGAAEHFLRVLTGDQVPGDWRGGLNITYRLGPSSSNVTIRMNISTQNSIRRADNVIAMIRGEVEPDRYVLFGNHRDAWVHGGIDPSSGTAVLLEVSRVMATLVKSGRWRPRRSIMFCSWGAEEYGLLGSTEWAEQYLKILASRAVAYVNVDIAVQGNYSFGASATPLLYKPLLEATKKIPNPNPEEISQGRKTVFDTWLSSSPSGSNKLPRIGSLGSGSDYAPLLQINGITSVDMRYTYNRKKYILGSYPLYHTEYETFDTVKNLLDRNFEYHQAIGRVVAEMVRNLADSVLIPFNVSDYAEQLEVNRQVLHKDYGALLQSNLQNYTDLEKIIKEFQTDVTHFQSAVDNLNRKDPMAIRQVNDQLSLLEKAFLDSAGLPDRPLKKHLIFAENSNDNYAGSSFPGLVDLLFEIESLPEAERKERWQKVQLHFSVILATIQTAGFTLRDVISFTQEAY